MPGRKKPAKSSVRTVTVCVQVAVQPPKPVTVSESVKLPAPPAITKTDAPLAAPATEAVLPVELAQTEDGAAIVATGSGLTVTVAVAAAVPPAASVTVTE